MTGIWQLRQRIRQRFQAHVRARIVAGIVEYREFSEEDVADDILMMEVYETADAIMASLFGRRPQVQ